MTTTGEITRGNGTFTTDPETLEEVENRDTIYSGKCKLRKVGSDIGTTGSIPGAVLVEDALILSIPVDAEGSGDVLPNDVWECTANPTDTSLVGARLRVASVHHGTYLTARRFAVEEVH